MAFGYQFSFAAMVITDAAAALQAADAIGYPVALKIQSPDISHKSDVGGVALDLRDGTMLEAAAVATLALCREGVPNARPEGV